MKKTDNKIDREKTATKKTSSKRTQKSTVKKDAELPSVDFEAAVKMSSFKDYIAADNKMYFE